MSISSALNTVRLVIIPLLVIGTTSVMGVLFHVSSQRASETQIRERMLNVVAVSALHFDGDALRQIRGPEDTDTQVYREAIATLQQIRELSPHVRFVYIMRKTDDPEMFAFVADADATLTLEQLDVNGNGIIDPDEESTLPGDLYPARDSPTLQGDAFSRPVVSEEMTEDQWGTLLSAYAPIRDMQGETVAVLGIDIEADEFLAMTQETFSIAAVIVVTLLGALLTAYIMLLLRNRRMEAMEQLNSERTALIDLAMHQLGMPLATFRWWVELLKENKGKAANEDAIVQLEEGVARMSKVLKAMTEVTQLRENSTDFRPAKVGLDVLIKRAVADADSQLKDRNQTMKVTLDKDLAPVLLDANLFVGILHELVQNASFYSPEGSAIEVRARRDKRMVAVEVIDQGYGIPEKDMPYIFDKFRRGSNAAQFRPVGNGLGLYIAKRVVDKSKGRIRVKSKLNEGTTVSILLPVAA